MPPLVSPCRHLPFQVLGQKVAPKTQFSDGSKKYIDNQFVEFFSCYKGRSDKSSASVHVQAETEFLSRLLAYIFKSQNYYAFIIKTIQLDMGISLSLPGP